jgi:lipoate-protein ligase A
MTGTDPTAWRLIDTGQLSGSENMAIDEALLDCFRPGESLPLLRLYGWSPPAFSCGRFQKPDEILDLERCREAGIPVVRRITGGGVIYHTEELTYSLVCPVAFIGATRGVRDAFFRLTAFLLAFYRNLGLAAGHAAETYSGPRRLGERTPLCFAGVEQCDILINGRKIGGNAQRRLKEVIFQHGSIPLRQMAGQADPFLLQTDPDILEKTTSLADEGIIASRDELAVMVRDAFAESFNIVFRQTGLTEAEQKCANGYMQKIE